MAGFGCSPRHCGFAREEWITKKTHVPSGRVALEDVVFFLVQEFKIRPLREDWMDVVAKNREAFLAYKTAE
jgi:hypothetical protein